MKRLSATSIGDALECFQRLYYRTNHPEAAKVSGHVIYGSIVHEAIEQFDNPDDAIEWSKQEWKVRSPSGDYMPDRKPKKPPKSFKKMFGNYYNVMEPQIDGGEKEVFFRLPWKGAGEEIEILGKMDRVTDTAVYDWKTGARKPTKYQLHNLQFYLYAWAFEKLHDRPPENVYYGYLNGGDLININLKPELMANLERMVNYVIVNMDLEPIRVVGYQCASCFYKDICFAHLDGAWTQF